MTGFEHETDLSTAPHVARAQTLSRTAMRLALTVALQMVERELRRRQALLRAAEQLGERAARDERARQAAEVAAVRGEVLHTVTPQWWERASAEEIAATWATARAYGQVDGELLGTARAMAVEIEHRFGVSAEELWARVEAEAAVEAAAVLQPQTEAERVAADTHETFVGEFGEDWYTHDFSGEEVSIETSHEAFAVYSPEEVVAAREWALRAEEHARLVREEAARARAIAALEAGLDAQLEAREAAVPAVEEEPDGWVWRDLEGREHRAGSREEADREAREYARVQTEREAAAAVGAVESVLGSDRSHLSVVPDVAEPEPVEISRFDQIVDVDDQVMVAALRGAETRDLAIALKSTANPEVMGKVLGNLSEGAAAEVRAEMNELGVVRPRAMEESQAKVLQFVRRAESEREAAGGASAGSGEATGVSAGVTAEARGGAVSRDPGVSRVEGMKSAAFEARMRHEFGDDWSSREDLPQAAQEARNAHEAGRPVDWNAVTAAKQQEAMQAALAAELSRYGATPQDAAAALGASGEQPPLGGDSARQAPEAARQADRGAGDRGVVPAGRAAGAGTSAGRSGGAGPGGETRPERANVGDADPGPRRIVDRHARSAREAAPDGSSGAEQHQQGERARGSAEQPGDGSRPGPGPGPGAGAGSGAGRPGRGSGGVRFEVAARPGAVKATWDSVGRRESLAARLSAAGVDAEARDARLIADRSQAEPASAAVKTTHAKQPRPAKAQGLGKGSERDRSR